MKPIAAVILALPFMAATTAFAQQATPSQQPAQAAPPAALAPIAVRWVKFVDPNQHAFTVDVPAGWRVTGGTKAVSSVDIRSGVEAISPDNTVDLFYGDPNVPIFTVPSPMLTRAGLRQGMTYSPGYGNQFLIEPYENGEAFAAQWGGSRVARDCTGVKRTGAQLRPDASQAIDSAYAQGGVRTSIIAGEAAFACTLRGGQGIGYVFAATELAQSQVSTLWDVKSLVGFVAAAPRAGAAYAILGHMVASFAVDPAWLAHYNQQAAQTSRIVAQTNALVSNTIAQNGRMQDDIANRTAQTGSNKDQISNMIVQGGAARSAQTMNAEGNYDQNAVRGTGTFSNPNTDTTFYNVDLTEPNHFVDGSGVVHNTEGSPPPGSNWQPLQRVQPGN